MIYISFSNPLMRNWRRIRSRICIDEMEHWVVAAPGMNNNTWPQHSAFRNCYYLFICKLVFFFFFFFSFPCSLRGRRYSRFHSGWMVGCALCCDWCGRFHHPSNISGWKEVPVYLKEKTTASASFAVKRSSAKNLVLQHTQRKSSPY